VTDGGADLLQATTRDRGWLKTKDFLQSNIFTLLNASFFLLQEFVLILFKDLVFKYIKLKNGNNRRGH